MPELEKNHYIPKFIIKHWLTQFGNRQRLHFYRISTKEKGTSGKNSDFSFAIRKDLYVPEIDGTRDVRLEKWFSRCEDALAALVQQAKQGRSNLTIPTMEHALFVQRAIHGLRYRSRYDLDFVRKFVDENPDIRQSVTTDPDRELDRLVLENLYNTIEEQTSRMKPLEVSFMATKKGSLILSDRPWIEPPNNGPILILTNKVAIYYERSNTGELIYQFKDLPNEIRDDLNKEIALQARDWLVADSEEILNTYISVVQSPEWEARRDQDHATGLPIEHLKTGANFENSEI